MKGERVCLAWLIEVAKDNLKNLQHYESTENNFLAPTVNTHMGTSAGLHMDMALHPRALANCSAAQGKLAYPIAVCRQSSEGSRRAA